MELTERKRDFLQAVERMYGETGRPVHYEEVAENLGVSKWTAYDVIKKLVQAGFLKIHYQRLSAPGRSRITVIPVAMGQQRQQTFRDILKIMQDIKQKKSKNILELLSKNIGEQPKGIFCAYVIVMSLLALRPVLSNKNFLELIAGEVCPQVILATLGGMMLGNLLKSKSEEFKQIEGYLQNYQQYISEATEEERKQLVEFLKKAVCQL
jgi:Mn-dependent DtxR family transcriptional regulator